MSGFSARTILGVADLRSESSLLGFLKPRPKLTLAREPAQLPFILDSATLFKIVVVKR